MTFDSPTCQFVRRRRRCREKTQTVIALETANGTDEICLCATHAAILQRRAGPKAKVIGP